MSYCQIRVVLPTLDIKNKFKCAAAGDDNSGGGSARLPPVSIRAAPKRNAFEAHVHRVIRETVSSPIVGWTFHLLLLEYSLQAKSLITSKVCAPRGRFDSRLCWCKCSEDMSSHGLLYDLRPGHLTVERALTKSWQRSRCCR